MGEVINLSTRILLGLVLGILVGAALNLFFPAAAPAIDQYALSPIGDGFLRLNQFVVVPIVFCSLILGLNSLEGSGRVGRYAGRLLFLYVVSSTLTLSVGLLTALALRPGVGVNVQGAEAVPAEPAQPLLEWLVSILPSNPFGALSTGNLLQVILSAVLIGAALGLLNEQKAPFVELIRSVYEVSLKILEPILRVMPLGMFALIASVIATQGFGLVARLIVYVLGLVAAILVMTLLYPLVLLVARAGPVFPGLLTGVFVRLRDDLVARGAAPSLRGHRTLRPARRIAGVRPPLRYRPQARRRGHSTGF